MEHLECDSFQEAVSRCLVRHRSILDCTSKLDEATARVNRAIAKAVTTCGCLKVSASRQRFPQDASFSELRNFTESHLEGSLCPECRDILESEIGRTLFYLTAVCELLGLDISDIMEKEMTRLSTLGIYNLT
ncbi:MAG: DUF1573 domain-containing protein [Bacillota bacterium]|nr:DUF1573 domain-containing protein [Bacillota bacterium]MDI9416094.1 DUF1573 domain-containing protein [Bacillota bacterium]NLD12474.1 DUF1573 domain-containing protein [Bacillota bacterium]HAV21267.1 DUF1573 domain-containing protein [Bacillota bacterium]HCD41241.1 DUF1573 domain-containing protein [Bacillota bacterium]